jgi:hypothetical protein
MLNVAAILRYKQIFSKRRYAAIFFDLDIPIWVFGRCREDFYKHSRIEQGFEIFAFVKLRLAADDRNVRVSAMLALL